MEKKLKSSKNKKRKKEDQKIESPLFKGGAKEVFYIVTWPIRKLFLLDFDLFSPASLSKRESKGEWMKTFRSLQASTFWVALIGYTTAYFIRSNLSAASQFLYKNNILDEYFYGLLTTAVLLGYAFGKVILGTVSDRSRPRYMLGTSLILTSLLNLLAGFLLAAKNPSSILLLIIFALIGWFQGASWPPIAKFFSHWLHPRSRASLTAIWSSSHNLGGAILVLIVGESIAIFSGVNYLFVISPFLIPSLITILMGFIVLFSFADIPGHYGLPTVEEYVLEEERMRREKLPISLEKKREEFQEAPEVTELESLTFRKILLERVIKKKEVWFLAIAQSATALIRYIPTIWILIFLTKTLHTPFQSNRWAYFFYESSAIFGTIGAGALSDYFLKFKIPFIGKNRRAWFIFAVSALLVFPFIVIHYGVVGKSPNIIILGLVIYGFLIYVPYHLLGLIGIEMVEKNSSGAVTCFMGFFSYLSVALIGGWVLAWFIKEPMGSGWFANLPIHHGFEWIFYAMYFFYVLLLVSILPLLKVSALQPKGEGKQ